MARLLATLRVAGARVCGVSLKRGHNSVRLVFEHGRLTFRGLWMCERRYTCPTCSPRWLRKQRDAIQMLLADNDTLGGDSVMVSLSLAFPLGLTLSERWGILRDLNTKLGASKRSRTARAAAGKIGLVKVVHPIHGEHGWHVHLHLLYILNRGITGTEADKLKQVETAVWADLADKAGCAAEPGVQTYTRIGRTEGDFKRVARYLTKGIQEIELGRKAPNLDYYTCRLERGKNRSPWQMLDDATFHDDTDALAPLREWVEVMESATFQTVHLPRRLMTRLHEDAVAVRESPAGTAKDEVA